MRAARAAIFGFLFVTAALAGFVAGLVVMGIFR